MYHLKSAMILVRTRPIDTSNNHGPVVNVITWFLLVASVLCVITRFVTKLAISRRLASDDVLILVALVSESLIRGYHADMAVQIFSIADSVAVSQQVHAGLGQHSQTLGTAQFSKGTDFEDTSRPAVINEVQSIYASNLVMIGSLCFAKLSVLMLLRTISPIKRHRHIILGIGGTVTLWAVSAGLVTAFQCHLPNPWMAMGNVCIAKSKPTGS